MVQKGADNLWRDALNTLMDDYGQLSRESRIKTDINARTTKIRQKIMK